MATPDPIVLPLRFSDASLTQVGGKGRALAAMASAGLPVPDGFLVSTRAYAALLDENDLRRLIRDKVDGIQVHQAATLDSVSAEIGSLFDSARIPTELADAIAQAYASLGPERPAVAVRSSATAEDLPHLSFAGQQDSFLNIRGEAELLKATNRCWASLWTARAIEYRRQMGIDQHSVAMGVIVQRMVDADVSGVLFTANPVTGERSELVINASFGLGEAIVAGQVTPDTYVLDRETLGIKQTRLGSKEAMVVPAPDQGTQTQIVPMGRRDRPSLSAETLRKLAELGKQTESQFDGSPQDIEWAVANNECWLLQSRPITHLPPPPLRDVRWEPPTKGGRLIRRQVVENMPEPLSPLFDELYLQEGLERSVDRLAMDFGLTFDLAEIMDRPMFLSVNGYAYCRANYHSTWRLMRVMPRVLFWYAVSLPWLLRNVVPLWGERGLPMYLATIEHWKSVDVTKASDGQLLIGVRALAVADAVYWFSVAIVLGAAKVTDAMLNRFLTSRLVPGDLTSGVFLRGFPSKTLEAQQELESIATSIRASAALRDTVVTSQPQELLETLRGQAAGQPILESIRRYLKHFGHQIYNLDFVQPTQIEEPLPVLVSLQALVESGEHDSAARLARMALQRDADVQSTLQTLGPVRRWLFRKLLRWATGYGPSREQALFYMGAAWPTLRGMATELGRRLVAADLLTRPEDVFFLESKELDEASMARVAGRPHADFAKLASDRRRLREARKRLHPPGMIPVGSRFRFGPVNMSVFETQKRNLEAADVLDGFAVSPGTVTAAATVVLSPADFDKMQPNTILVCPTTTPAWTPLFAQSLGLVTDVGGILAHGSIVAREYGIPAVMGTGNGTKRIVSGQTITVDGDSGTVTIL